MKKQLTKAKDNIQGQEKRKGVALTPPPFQRKENRTGMPDHLKSGIENLSGMDMSDVKVHYNSSQPAQLNAHAYAQGNQIHIAPGQEKHLPHEAWHVVQQKQGRVKSTMQMKGKVSINDEVGLENEADVMGSKALQMKIISDGSAFKTRSCSSSSVVQKVDYPPDTFGTIDKTATVRTDAGDKEVPISGAQLQKEIIGLAKKAEAKETGGYRLGTFGLALPNKLSRIQDPYPENHGMTMLPHGFNTGPLDERIKPLVILTLEDSGQLSYLAKNWVSIHETHTVIIDVDCQFNRHQGALGFHKDSRGTTVFFNLTYSNEDRMQGPDYYQDHIGAKDLEEKLPTEVQSDIETRRQVESAARDTRIQSPMLEPFARVSLSDPNLYHSTPKLGHRTRLPRAEMIQRLIAKYNTEDKDYTSYFKSQTDNELLGWIEPYNFHNTESKTLKDREGDFRTTAATRERRLSTQLSSKIILQQALDLQAALPRTFIRTWVRMVPKPFRGPSTARIEQDARKAKMYDFQHGTDLKK